MTIDKLPHGRMTVTPVEEFLRKPPAGFSVEALGSGYKVHSDPEKSLVLIDDFNSCSGKVVFQNSLGRKVKMHNLWEYTSTRKSLLAKNIHLLVSACEENCAGTKKAVSEPRVLQQFVVSIDCNDPFIRWQMEKGLDWTISSVAGESYRVDIDVAQLLESWAEKNTYIMSDELVKVNAVWRDTSFTLKYYSDALFDFPHWFGFSKRRFTLRPT
ncbi:uncharacterized protein V6R79_005842 [Siganus canaliculatus]